MKKTVILFMGMVCLQPVNAEVIKEYFDDGVLKAEINFRDGTSSANKWGIKEGLEKIYYNTATLAYSVHYLDGLREGKMTWLDRAGHTLEELHYKKGKLEGINTIFYVNGKIKSQVKYVEDKKEGIKKEYFDTGVLALKVNYIHNKKEGIQEEYFEDGQLYSKVMYKNNYKEGLKEWYDKKGKTVRTEFYKMDRPINVMKEVQKNNFKY